MRRTFIVVMSAAVGALALLGGCLALGWHQDSSAGDKNKAAALRANQTNAADYLTAAAAALRTGPLTVGQLKTLAEKGPDPDRVDAAKQGSAVVIRFEMTARYASPGSFGDGVESSCFQGTVQSSGAVAPGQPIEIPCTQVSPLPDMNAKVSLR